MVEKATIRSSYGAVRKGVTPDDLARAGEDAAGKLASFLDSHQSIRTVACYLACGSEMPTAPAIRLMRERSIAVALPSWDGSQYRFVAFDGETPLISGPHGIPQPSAGMVLDAATIDLFLVPGLAFDLSGGRVGYGGGWYDRLLARRRPDSIALGFCLAVQIAPSQLPREPHDIILDGVIAGD